MCVSEKESKQRKERKMDDKASSKRLDPCVHATVFVKRRKVCDEIQSTVYYNKD